MVTNDASTQVLDDQSAPPWDDDTPAKDRVTEGAVLGDGVDTQAGTLPACTAEEARELVTRARGALIELDTTMTEIIRRRAWEPLGYADPKSFWVKEFGPGSGGPNPLSKTHVYRTARVLAVLYGLSERLGDDALAIDISERALRSIPAGEDGANDVALMESIQERVEAGAEDVQGVVDEEIKAAQQKLNAGQHPGEGDEPSEEDLTKRMSQMGLTAPSADGDDDGEDHPEPAIGDADVADDDGHDGVSLSSVSGLEVSEEVIGQSLLAADLQKGMQLLAALEDDMASVLPILTNSELRDLAALTRSVKQAVEAVERHADNTLSDDYEGPIEIDADDI